VPNKKKNIGNISSNNFITGRKKKIKNLYSILKQGFKILSSQGEESFKLRPCKTAATQQLPSIDWRAGKLQESVASGFLGPEFAFSRMRYGLHSTRMAAAKHDLETGFWCTANERKIIGPIIFSEKIMNSNRNVMLTLTSLSGMLPSLMFPDLNL